MGQISIINNKSAALELNQKQALENILAAETA